MESVTLSEPIVQIHEQLVERRRRLEAVIAEAPDPTRLVGLLREVDDAIARVAGGQFGVCVACRGAIERDRLSADPLARTCLECLTAAEQRALEQDLDLAGHVQQTLLPPRRLQLGGWETAYEYQPLGPASGDYVDIMPLESGELVFLVGDVSGKGVSASLLMTHLHATVRSLIPLGLPLEEVVRRTNRVFHQSAGGNRYATLLCGKAAVDGEVELSNAGHCPPIVLRGTGAATLSATSVPIGLFADVPFPTVRLSLDPGDSLIVYTDGVTEASDASGCEYGRDRLAAVALGRQHVAAPDLVSGCVADLAAFRRHDQRRDDVTLFALCRV